MPELPDLQIYKEYIDSTSLDQRISSIEIRKERLIGNVEPDEFQKKLEDKKFKATERQGKHLFVETDDGIYLVMHFGMSGFPEYFKTAPEHENHHRVLFHFDNEFSLAYVSQRMLGKMEFASDIGDYLKENDLSKDALKMGKEEIITKLKSKSGMIKSALMDQSKFSGIGNIYSDEILFHAGIHPKTKVNDLSENKMNDIYENMHYALGKAIEARVDLGKMPDDFLLPHRGKEGDHCPKCGGTINAEKVSSRTSYFCPDHQK